MTAARCLSMSLTKDNVEVRVVWVGLLVTPPRLCPTLGVLSSLADLGALSEAGLGPVALLVIVRGPLVLGVHLSGLLATLGPLGPLAGGVG